MKIDKSHIGVKLTGDCWDEGKFFIPLAQTKSGHWVGERQDGSGDYFIDRSDWEFYREKIRIDYETAKYFQEINLSKIHDLLSPNNPPKIKRIEAAPAVRYSHDGTVKITDIFYASFEQARKWIGSKFITYPAKFDAVKGCWFYEYEEEK